MAWPMKEKYRNNNDGDDITMLRSHSVVFYNDNDGELYYDVTFPSFLSKNTYARQLLLSKPLFLLVNI